MTAKSAGGPRIRRIVVVAGVVLVLAALAVGGWMRFRPPSGPLPPPDAPWPVTGTLSVYLCSKDSALDNCHHVTTIEQQERLEGVLRGTRGVSALRLEGQLEAWGRFVANYGHDKTLIADTRPSDMPVSFRGEVADVWHFSKAWLEKLPGVARVHVEAADFWVGKSDLEIRMCPQETVGQDSQCKGRGEASDQEKASVYKALRGVDGVDDIYLEGHEHAVANLRNILMDKKGLGDAAAQVPEIYQVTLESKDVAERVRRVVGRMPGVDYVTDHYNA
ncbi:permease-like cell division protein FtsX [Nonomuraea sp. NPDC050536]|uniref:permease-like cell division protein FtsX n=1 Tax=Nonomuraea sp. NPDC050536 TaxID=3364366 RepID=UPI0037C858A6